MTRQEWKNNLKMSGQFSHSVGQHTDQYLKVNVPGEEKHKTYEVHVQQIKCPVNKDGISSQSQPTKQ